MLAGLRAARLSYGRSRAPTIGAASARF